MGSFDGLREKLESIHIDSQRMEEMNLEQAVEIPDTPDRSRARYGQTNLHTVIRGNGHLPESQPRNNNFVNRTLSPHVIGSRNGRYGRKYHSSGVPVLSDGAATCSGSNAVSSSRRSDQWNRPALFRRASSSYKGEGAHSGGTQMKERLKTTFRTDESSMYRRDDVLGATRERGINLDCSPNAPKNSLSGSSRYASKGKNVVGSSSLTDDASFLNCDRGRNTTSWHENKYGGNTSGDKLPCPPRRTTENKRLVRNGCISPSNIALMVKTVDDARKTNSSDNGSNVTIRNAENRGMIEEKESDRSKGKGVIVYPTSMKPVTRHHPLVQSSVSPTGFRNEVSGQSTSAMANSWMSSRVHDRDAFQNRPSSALEEYMIDQERNFMNNTNRKRRRGPNASNEGECSTPSYDLDSEVVVLGSSRRQLSAVPFRAFENQQRRNLGSIAEVDEHTVTISDVLSDDVVCLENVNFETVSNQLEEDERLARQLQEQLYNEIDEDLAWTLQHEDYNSHSSSPIRSFSFRENLSAATFRRQRRPPSSSARDSHHFHPASRALPTRNRAVNRAYASTARNRNRVAAALSMVEDVNFPLTMDLDMRLDVLEALEEAVGDFDDLNMASNGIRTTASHLLHLERDFNENDYEMLSALDECNHRKEGLTSAQIRSLPESVVQVEVCDETCAVCLETPAKGEKIRHLTCLHKFHKDCIDEWLKRKTLCPICKSPAV